MQNQMDCPLNIQKIGNERKNFCTLNRVIWKEAAGQCVNLIFPTMRCNRIKISFFLPPLHRKAKHVFEIISLSIIQMHTTVVLPITWSHMPHCPCFPDDGVWRLSSGEAWIEIIVVISSAFLLFHNNPLIWSGARSWPHDHLKRHSHRYCFKIWHSIR